MQTKESAARDDWHSGLVGSCPHFIDVPWLCRLESHRADQFMKDEKTAKEVSSPAGSSKDETKSTTESSSKDETTKKSLVRREAKRMKRGQG
jgi:hypothetical protein